MDSVSIERLVPDIAPAVTLPEKVAAPPSTIVRASTPPEANLNVPLPFPLILAPVVPDVTPERLSKLPPICNSSVEASHTIFGVVPVSS